jgi:hypothetical protein
VKYCIAVLLVGLLTSADAFAKKGGTDRPFSGSAFGSLTSGPGPGEDPAGPYVLDYVLQATHMGKGTRTEIAFIGGGNIYGTQIWTAANGDQIFVDFVATITAPFTSEGVYTFVGGTGRFENASGEADFIAIGGFSDLSVFFEGTLSY